MRIAVIDLLFSWPPHGGADVDVYHVVRELSELGHEPCLFIAREDAGWERGRADRETLPFPAVFIDFAGNDLTVNTLVSRFLNAVDAYRPDAVFITQGYFLRTPLILALTAYPLVLRCYAHETACQKDILRFRNGAPCNYAYINNPDQCRRCALSHFGGSIRKGLHDAWIREYMAVEAWSNAYYADFRRAMNQIRAFIVTTEHMRGQVNDFSGKVYVIPHGVDTERFTPMPCDTSGGKPVLLVPGRMEDPAKGFSVLMAAAGILADAGMDFEVQATLPEGYEGPHWLRPVGKVDFDAMPDAYRRADICIIPSIWEEPFGIVALEAMATGIPVCASRVGGLQDIVVHGETGFLFERGNAAQLAEHLKRLLQDTALRRLMGDAGRRRVLEQYQWKHLVEKYYPPLLAGL